MVRWLAALFLLALPAEAAEEVVADLSQSRVGINATFNGSEILVFGAVRRNYPVSPAGELGVVITVAGPSTPVVVRKKDRTAGIWVNTEAVEVDRAPSFYQIVTTGPLVELISATEDLRHGITIDRAIRSVGAPVTVGNAADFTEALIRIRTNDGAYAVQEGGVTIQKDTLFRANVALPANLTEGNYTTRIFLTRNGDVVSSHTTTIHVSKVGLERFLHSLAFEQPLLYGLLSLAIAIAAGWGASAVFRYIRG
ncbi:MAG: TIGR02186 family protein [Vannielia sp.]|uniref:TIGR02186 family protein n=1 Tax=Vannielia sp. TaxID=2813045 RepID=UPI003B8C3479